MRSYPDTATQTRLMGSDTAIMYVPRWEGDRLFCPAWYLFSVMLSLVEHLLRRSLWQQGNLVVGRYIGKV